MRPSELLGIKIENINLDERYMVGGVKTKAGKNRIIPIHSKILPFVKHLYSDKKTYLVEYSENKPMSRSKFIYEFEKTMKCLNMNHLPHDGRHTFASMANKAVSKWERDVARPDTGTIPKLAEILGISVEELMNAKNQPQQGHKGSDYFINLILRAVPIAMGIAVTTTSLLGTVDVKHGLSMLGIGVACLGIYLLKNN